MLTASRTAISSCRGGDVFAPSKTAGVDGRREYRLCCARQNPACRIGERSACAAAAAFAIGNLASRAARKRRANAVCLRASNSQVPEPLLILQRREVNLCEGSSGVGGASAIEVEFLPLSGTGKSDPQCIALSTGVQSVSLLECARKALRTDLKLDQSEDPVVIPAIRVNGNYVGERKERCVSATHKGLLEDEPSGFRASVIVDCHSWLREAKASQGCLRGAPEKESSAFMEWTLLPSPKFSKEQLGSLVGRRAREYFDGVVTPVEGDANSASVSCKSTQVDPPGIFACGNEYNFRMTIGKESKMEQVGEWKLDLQPLDNPEGTGDFVLPGPLDAATWKGQENPLDKVAGIIGQQPLLTSFEIDVDPSRSSELPLYRLGSAQRLAEADSLEEALSIPLPLDLLALRVSAAGAEGGGDKDAAVRAAIRLPDLDNRPLVPALLDSGASISCINWPAAELLFGLTRDSPEVKAATRIASKTAVMSTESLVQGDDELRDVPLLELELALPTVSQRRISLGTRLVAIADLKVFESLGCEDTTSKEEFFGSVPGGFLGLGQGVQRPAALLGQDVLSQRRYVLASAAGRFFFAA